MDIEGIAKELTWLAYRLDSMRSHQATVEGLETTNILREAAAILRTHPDAKPNDPLTLEELREMDGEPVWISYFAGGSAVCMLVDAKHDVCRDAHGGFAVFENLGNTWMAYRRRPEEKK